MRNVECIFDGEKNVCASYKSDFGLPLVQGIIIVSPYAILPFKRHIPGGSSNTESIDLKM